MREIKFRVWDSLTNQMLYLGRQLDEHIGGEPDHLMQYTGFKDNNGNDVYEGDILAKEGHWSFFVTFANGSFRRTPVDPVQRVNWEHQPLDKYWLLDSGFSVVGNIYENPVDCPHKTIKYQLHGFLNTCEDCGEVL